MPSPHHFQNLITGMLKWNIKVFADVIAFLHDPDYLAGKPAG